MSLLEDLLKVHPDEPLVPSWPSPRASSQMTASLTPHISTNGNSASVQPFPRPPDAQRNSHSFHSRYGTVLPARHTGSVWGTAVTKLPSRLFLKELSAQKGTWERDILLGLSTWAQATKSKPQSDYIKISECGVWIPALP